METIILFAPLLGAVICGFGWRIIGEKAAITVATALLFLAAALSWIVFFTFDGHTHEVELFRWINSGTLQIDWSLRLDRLTSIMLVVVTTISALVHLYSFGYMDNDPNWRKGEVYKPRFFANLSFFTFNMLALVTANNILQLFYGWEGVGLSSYLLIGFYWRKPSAVAAGIKAFLTNRIGDVGFALGIFGLYYLTDSLRFDDIFAAGPKLAATQVTFLWGQWNAVNLIVVLLFIGAMGKSAQLFLHVWLPDAMEGPTPVSALIHAATMVTAGVFLVVRMSPLVEFAPHAAAFITIIGASTAFFAATIGLVQTDIKRVVAYSTISQLGYMFAAAGIGLYSVAMFHLLTHAFFKALLFLGAGSVITAMHHEQDMRNYGGLRKKIPFTFWSMMAGTLAITGLGIPFTHIGFAGFLSKDAIIEGTWGAHTAVGTYAFWMLVIAAAFTSFYSWRLMFLTFYGKPRGNKHAHEHARESGMSMLIPLGVLALGATFAGMIWYGQFFGNEKANAAFFSLPPAQVQTAEAATGTKAAVATPAKGWVLGDGSIFIGAQNHVLEAAHKAPAWAKLAPFIAMVLGFAVAWAFYIFNTSWPRKLAEQQRLLYLFLLNKWYFDELYEVIFVRFAKFLGRFLWKKGDGEVIDGTINGVAMGIVPWVTRLAGRAQSGYIFHYAFAMVVGLVFFVTWFSISGGAQ